MSLLYKRRCKSPLLLLSFIVYCNGLFAGGGDKENNPVRRLKPLSENNQRSPLGASKERPPAISPKGHTSTTKKSDYRSAKKANSPDRRLKYLPQNNSRSPLKERSPNVSPEGHASRKRKSDDLPVPTTSYDNESNEVTPTKGNHLLGMPSPVLTNILFKQQKDPDVIKEMRLVCKRLKKVCDSESEHQSRVDRAPHLALIRNSWNNTLQIKKAARLNDSEIKDQYDQETTGLFTSILGDIEDKLTDKKYTIKEDDISACDIEVINNTRNKVIRIGKTIIQQTGPEDFREREEVSYNLSKFCNFNVKLCAASKNGRCIVSKDTQSKIVVYDLSLNNTVAPHIYELAITGSVSGTLLQRVQYQQLAVNEEGSTVFLLGHEKHSRAINLSSFHRTMNKTHFTSPLEAHGDLKPGTRFKSIDGLWVQNKWLYILTKQEECHSGELTVLKFDRQKSVHEMETLSMETTASAVMLHPNSQYFYPAGSELEVMTTTPSGSLSMAGEKVALDLEANECVKAGAISACGHLLTMVTNRGRVLVYSLFDPSKPKRLGEIDDYLSTDLVKGPVNIEPWADLTGLSVLMGQKRLTVDLRGGDSLSTDVGSVLENESTDITNPNLEATSGIGQQE